MAKLHASDVQDELDFATERNAVQYDNNEQSNAVIVFDNMSFPCIFDCNANELRLPNKTRYESAEFFRTYVNYRGFVKMNGGEKYGFDYLQISRYDDVTIVHEYYYPDEDRRYGFVPF